MSCCPGLIHIRGSLMNWKRIEGSRVGSFRCWQLVALSAVVLLSGWIAGPAEAQRREDLLAGLSSSQRRIFQNYTRMYCQQFFRFDDDRFVLLPNYYRERENSTGRTYDQAFEEMTHVEVIKRGAIVKEIRHEPPAAEVIVAARVIPAIEVGHYGFVNSVIIKDIVGPSEMIVTAIELIPPSEVGTENNTLRKAAEERQREYEYNSYRLLGFSTKDLKVGDKYYGPRKKGLQVAVMSTDPQHKFVLVDYDRLQRVRTSEFAEALDYVQIEPLAFIDMVRENRETLTTDGDKASLIYIYRRYYNRYRPKRLSSTPQVAIPEPKPEPKPEVKPEPEIDEPKVNEPQTKPEVQPEPKPKPKFEPKPREEEEDDWDYEDDTESAPDKPTFFGIPL